MVAIARPEGASHPRCRKPALRPFPTGRPPPIGRLPVRLQAQNQACSAVAAFPSTGVNSLPLCEPSQNGGFFERPQAHHQELLRASTSTGSGCRPPISGTALMLLLLAFL